jgi:hypothetical protein
MRNCSLGHTARKKPAKLDPIAGASFEVRDLATRGLRFRNRTASLERRLSRNRTKKRRSRRWKRRMSARELLRRTLGDFQIGSRCSGLDSFLAHGNLEMSGDGYLFAEPRDRSLVLINSHAFSPDNVTMPNRKDVRTAATL